MKSRLPASVVLCLLTLISAGWLLSLDWEQRLSTDILELIPDRSPDPELSLGRSVLNDRYSNRVMVAMQGVEDAAAVDAYVVHLEASPLVERVLYLNDADRLTEVGRYVFEHRFELLFPDWLERSRAGLADGVTLAEKLVQDLDAALNDPSFLAFEDLVPSDPLLLMRDAADTFQLAQTGQVEDSTTELLEVILSVSALKAAGQEPVFKLLKEAELAAADLSPGIRVLDTGAHRYAAESEQKMRKEVEKLNLSTVVIVFLICAFLCRRVFLVFHIFLILLVSLLAGLALMLCFFEQVHVFALIFGCVLCGVIVDYGLHAYWHDGGEGRRSLRTFLKPFLISCGSSLMGFSILLFSELPVLRQMGLMVVCGLFMAVCVTLLYVFAVLGGSPKSPRFSKRCAPSRKGAWSVILLGICALALLPFVHWEDDIRNLKYPLPHLDAVDQEIRDLHGGEREVLLTVGADYASSRASLEQLTNWMTQQGASPQLRLNAGGWVPTFESYQIAQQFIAQHPSFAEEVLLALERGGFDPQAFNAFEAAWSAIPVSDAGALIRYQVLLAQFAEVLDEGLAGLVGSHDGLYWWVTLVDPSVDLEALPPELNSIRLSQVESMSAVLSRYRERTMELSLLGGAVICGVLLFAFGLRDGPRILLVPLFSVASATVAIYFSFGALGIFHLIGLFLGACLVLDYAVFSWIGLERQRQIPFSVAVSSLTTVASFFVLSLSRIPAIHALGLAVFLATMLGAMASYLLLPQLSLKQEVDHAS
jgi:predicted exporter